MIFKTNNKRILTKNGLSQSEALRIVKQVEAGDFEVIEVLKDHPRSKVSHIKLDKVDLVLKVPREKNKRAWIRFLTLFRKSEVFKNLLGMKLLNTLGFSTTKSLLACEYRKWGMVTDSWLLYQYLYGKECLDRPATFESVVELVENMHAKHILHGDAQIRNFLTNGTDIYTIDANPKKSTSSFAKAYELAYLKRSQPNIEHVFRKEKKRTFMYWLAVKFDFYERLFARKKRALKKYLNFT